MAYEPHTLVTFGGTLQEVGAADEIWQCGVRGFAQGGGPVISGNLQTLADNVWNGNGGSGGGLSALISQANGKIPTTVALRWVKVANIGADGGYTEEPKVHQGNVIGASAAVLPSFCTVAISWGTGLTLGKAVRGRIYPPNFAAALAAGATISTATQNGLAAWGKDLYTVLFNAITSAPFIPHVVSSSGAFHPITRVRVGNVIDTQRRRKEAVPETYADIAAF